VNVFKRGFFAIVRKPIKSIVSGLIIFCIAVLTTIGISAGYTSHQVQLAARNNVGAYFELTLSVENLEERTVALMEQGYDITAVPAPPASQMTLYAAPNFEFISLLLDDIRILSQVAGILDYNVEAIWHEMRAVNFRRIEGDFPRPTDIAAVSLRGVRDLSLMSFVQDGSISLLSGRWINADDVDKLVISSELAEANDLVVGDSLVFETLPMKDSVMLQVMERHGYVQPPLTQIQGEIIGIFQNNRSITITPGVVARSTENSIFTNLHFTEVGMHESDPHYYKAYFHVQNVDEFENIRERLLLADINWSRYELINRNQTIEELGASFAQIRDIGQIMLIITIASGFLILSLAFTLFMKTRSHEIGIWLSLGEKKKTIALQMVWENLLLSITALLICFAAVPFIARSAETLLNNQIVAEIPDTSNMSGQLHLADNVNEIERVSLAITTDTLTLVAGAIVLLIITTTVIAIIPIIKLKPREIFSRLS
jgi:putative ABC transport system permease protein